MKIRNPKSIKERFLIFPFYCARCHERFMLEHGAIEKNPRYEIGDWFFGAQKYNKYCYDCTAKEFRFRYEVEERKENEYCR